MGLQAEIWARRLGEGGTKEEEKKKKEEEKIPHMCESIGHRPLWGRCPKTESLDRFIVVFRFPVIDKMVT